MSNSSTLPRSFGCFVDSFSSPGAVGPELSLLYGWAYLGFILTPEKYLSLQTCQETLKAGFTKCWWEGRAGQGLHL